jgi:cytochrome b6-f complex iron-sulfur subunit
VSDADDSGRRSFLARASMLGGLLSAFGTAVVLAARYIYPREGIRRRREVFLAPLRDIPVGKGRPYTLPSGATALVTNTGAELVALSDVCPHLGCKVHWEEEKREFLCPCHGGVFAKDGKALAGPPADEKKDLTKFVLKQVGDNLFIEIEEIVHL